MTDTNAVPAGGPTLRPARLDDLEAARTLMRSCHLPDEGLADQFGEAYVVAETEGKVVGVAGVERHGSWGLLRSVAVLPRMRRSGLGAALVADRIAWADRRGVKSLFLLTTDAERFFDRHGFVRVERTTAPPEIRTSSQFTGLCPSSATLMERVVGPSEKPGERPDAPRLMGDDG